MARIGRAAYASVLVAVGGACLSIFESSALAWGYPEDFASFDRVWMRLALGLAALIGAPVLVGAWLLPGKALHLVGAAWGALASALLAYHAGSPFVLGALLCLLGAGAGARLIAARGARPAGIVALALAIVLAAAPPPWSSSRAPAWSAAEAERPGNVIFIVIDTLRADHLSAWGYQAPQAVDPATSPVIDALAADGARFAQAYAQAPWTRPSAASYLTGLYPQSHAIATQFDRLSEQVPTLAEFLRDAGFRTVGFSANPQVSPPFGLSQGFDRFWNPSSYFQSATFLRAVRRHPWVTAVESQLRPQPAASAGPPQRGIPNSDADAVNRAVRGWMQGVSDDRPTFLYLHYLDPHDPYNAPVDYLYSDPDSHRQRDESVFHADRLVPPRPLQGSIMDSTSDAELRDHIRRYDTEIRFVDTRLGEMLDELRAAGLYRQDRDLVILTSDHGEEFYEHQQWLHGQSLYEEMIHVPLILRGPGWDAGTVREDAVELIDLVPTIAAWLGRELPWPVQGVSLLDDPRPTGEERLVFSHRPREQHAMDMVRVGDRKLIRVDDAAGEPVYLVAEDLNGGMEPTAATPTHQVPIELLDLLDAFRERAPLLKRDGRTEIELDAAMRDSLRRLGYLDDED